ncbi:MAG: hypothetical protein JNL02_12625 [Saprospiraceae bacterium]|nr:hypothetical protein [Saprospiraceae bacterium]
MTLRFPEVYCERCKRPVLPQHVDRARNNAFCDACDLTFSIPKRKSSRRRKEAFLPAGAKNIRLSLFQKEMVIDVRWRKNYPISRILNIKPPESLELHQHHSRELRDTIFIVYAIEAIYTSLHYTIGAITRTSAYLFNRTKVIATKDYLQVEHRPIDVLPGAFFSAAQIEQLSVRPTLLWEGSKRTQATLFVRLKNGEEYDILWDLETDVLLYLEQEIERLLGIEDVGVEGEII